MITRPSVSRPSRFHFPISHEHDHRLYENVKASILSNQIMNSAGISPRLIERLPLFLATANEDPLPVLELDLARTVAELPFDGKHPRRPDDHVINIEPIPNNVVEAAEVIRAQFFQLFCHDQRAAIQLAELPPEPAELDRRNPRRNDGEAEINLWLKQLMGAGLKIHSPARRSSRRQS